MDIENIIAVFVRKLMLQRYSVDSIKNYCSAVRSFLQVAEKKFNLPDELSENEIEKYVHWKNKERQYKQFLSAFDRSFYR